MNYDFDKIINRKNTNSVKYDFLKEHGFPADTIPLWVADMDFAAPREVTARLKEIAEHGVFGYSDTKPAYFDAVHHWFSGQHGFDVQSHWMVKTPGVVFAIAAAIRAFSKEGEGVLIQRPVYYPFERVIRSNGRKVINNPLVYKNGKYEIDFAGFESLLQRETVKLFILCNPHNPVGRVWTEEEHIKMGELCLRHHVLVISDEIHCDFLYPGYRHIPFPSISPAFAENSILCTSPSKTFNLAGLQVANIFIPNKSHKNRFVQSISATGFGGLSIFGLAACETAYTYGKQWLSELKDYLYKNLRFVKTFISENLPNIHLIEPEGTYLLWLDFSGYHLSDSELNELIKNKAGLWLDEGSLFGAEGQGFQRMNIACPREILRKSMERLHKALAENK